MSQSSILTRCPHCETRFRVTQEQLGIAGGKVRCGQCMNVFNALEHQQDSPEPAEPDETTSTAPQETDSGDDVVFADNPEEDAAEGHYAGEKFEFEAELSDSFLSIGEDTREPYSETVEPEEESVDESWAEAILEDEHPSDTSENGKKEKEPAEETPSTEAITPEPPTRPQQNRSDDSDTATPSRDELTMEDDAPKPDWDRETSEMPDDGAPATPWTGLRSEPISIPEKENPWLRRIVWLIVIAGLIGLLISQVTYYQFDRLATIPQLRPLYEKACEYAECELPPLVALDKIDSRKLVVRNDPDARGTLIVDAVMINEATFRQPFPAIGLSFSNLQGEVVAQSTFAPGEYLKGAAKEMTQMPPGTPVRLSISIRDPGRDAVNYNLEFLPQQPQSGRSP